MLHIYSGDGKGKTTAAVGLAVRALGCGRRVLFVQFFKNGDSGEVDILRAQPNLTYLKAAQDYRLFAWETPQGKAQATKAYHDLLDDAIALMNDTDCPDCAIAPDVREGVGGERNQNNFDLVVLDEAISCYNFSYLCKESLLALCEKASGAAAFELVLTGRDPEQALSALADYHSSVQKIKHPYDAGQPARKGVEF